MLTHGQIRRMSAWDQQQLGYGGRSRPDAEWAAAQVDQFPAEWAHPLLKNWEAGHARARTKANLHLLKRSRLVSQAMRAGLPADASDADIVSRARASAVDTERRLRHVQAIGEHVGDAPEVIQAAQVVEARRLLDGQGLLEFWPAGRGYITERGALRRLACDRWWRRVLRRIHAMTIEACAIDLGLVHKRAECYVSNVGVKQRRGQVARNTRAMEGTMAVNDGGQAYALAELAAKGPSNALIRRAELMTRIAGFELIAKDCLHAAWFVTVTCPSHMHAQRTRRKGVARFTEQNPAYDGTKPTQAQRHLVDRFAACRKRWGRKGIGVYGFRIAEPNHDGTPHWHLLMFFEPQHADEVRAALHKNFILHDLPEDQRAARDRIAHGIKTEVIDWTRGSAASYVAKYVSKNIDGYRVEYDLYGNAALEASERVQAWASRWRIRQFQQIGGPPVTVWRELRRISPEAMDGDEVDTLKRALSACNVAKHEPGAASMGFRRYVELQGGPMAGRKGHRVTLYREQTGELGRYGEASAPRAVGVIASGKAIRFIRVPMRDTLGPDGEVIPGGVRVPVEATAVVQSERHEWLVVPGVSLDEAKRLAVARGEAVRPWTRVNNCPPPPGWKGDMHMSREWNGPVTQIRPKVGRVFRWDERSTTTEAGEGGHARQISSLDPAVRYRAPSPEAAGLQDRQEWR
jgi:hypothetical protein